MSAEPRACPNFVHQPVAECLSQSESQVESIEGEEGQEVLVILVPEAVVYKGAVVVEKLNTSLANLAVEISFSLDHLIVGAEVIEVNSLSEGLVNYSHEVKFRLNVAWVHARGTYKESESK